MADTQARVTLKFGADTSDMDKGFDNVQKLLEGMAKSVEGFGTRANDALLGMIHAQQRLVENSPLGTIGDSARSAASGIDELSASAEHHKDADTEMTEAVERTTKALEEWKEATAAAAKGVGGFIGDLTGVTDVLNILAAGVQRTWGLPTIWDWVAKGFDKSDEIGDKARELQEDFQLLSISAATSLAPAYLALEKATEDYKKELEVMAETHKIVSKKVIDDNESILGSLDKLAERYANGMESVLQTTSKLLQASDAAIKAIGANVDESGLKATFDKLFDTEAQAVVAGLKKSQSEIFDTIGQGALDKINSQMGPVSEAERSFLKEHADNWDKFAEVQRDYEEKVGAPMPQRMTRYYLEMRQGIQQPLFGMVDDMVAAGKSLEEIQDALSSTAGGQDFSDSRSFIAQAVRMAKELDGGLQKLVADIPVVIPLQEQLAKAGTADSQTRLEIDKQWRQEVEAQKKAILERAETLSNVTQKQVNEAKAAADQATKNFADQDTQIKNAAKNWQLVSDARGKDSKEAEEAKAVYDGLIKKKGEELDILARAKTAYDESVKSKGADSVETTALKLKLEELQAAQGKGSEEVERARAKYDQLAGTLKAAQDAVKAAADAQAAETKKQEAALTEYAGKLATAFGATKAEMIALLAAQQTGNAQFQAALVKDAAEATAAQDRMKRIAGEVVTSFGLTKEEMLKLASDMDGISDKSAENQRKVTIETLTFIENVQKQMATDEKARRDAHQKEVEAAAKAEAEAIKSGLQALKATTEAVFTDLDKNVAYYREEWHKVQAQFSDVKMDDSHFKGFMMALQADFYQAGTSVTDNMKRIRSAIDQAFSEGDTKRVEALTSAMQDYAKQAVAHFQKLSAEAKAAFDKINSEHDALVKEMARRDEEADKATEARQKKVGETLADIAHRGDNDLQKQQRILDDINDRRAKADELRAEGGVENLKKAAELEEQNLEASKRIVAVKMSFYDSLNQAGKDAYDAEINRLRDIGEKTAEEEQTLRKLQQGKSEKSTIVSAEDAQRASFSQAQQAALALAAIQEESIAAQKAADQEKMEYLEKQAAAAKAMKDQADAMVQVIKDGAELNVDVEKANAKIDAMLTKGQTPIPLQIDISAAEKAIDELVKPRKLIVNVEKSGEGSTPAMASGGPVPGYGSGDIVPAWLTPGEFVISKPAVDHYGQGLFRDYNARRFASGGPVEPTMEDMMKMSYTQLQQLVKDRELAHEKLVAEMNANATEALENVDKMDDLVKKKGDTKEQQYGSTFDFTDASGDSSKEIPENIKAQTASLDTMTSLLGRLVDSAGGSQQLQITIINKSDSAVADVARTGY